MSDNTENVPAAEAEAQDVEMDSDDDADNLLNQIVSGEVSTTLKRAYQGNEGDAAAKVPKMVDDPLYEKFESLQANFYSKRIDVLENCIHEVVCPTGIEVELKERQTEPAKTYPFQLDVFQKKAITCIDNNQSVLVSAHTSAGKTVVALYAIALALRDKQRVIYTSPIKALSNQKYRELQAEFHDVGLMTGDVTINPEASCIVMTTEILRSMLYRGSSMMHEIGWVIFDEIHYMRDKERGVVWEETIIMLADSVHYVFLSATIPNALQFASWVCSLHHQPCHVVYTDYRPTPLQHFIYPVGSTGLFEVVGTDGRFRAEKFNEAMRNLSSGDSTDAGGRQASGRRRDPAMDNNVLKMISTIKERDMLPCIVFSFSRKECEGYASTLKDINFTANDADRKCIDIVFQNAINCLSEEDRQLPQVHSVLPFLRRGIGVHHSGLLPILKEVIEILFGEGLIKVLFATETFAMGLNMPARTVLFTSVRKFDGKNHRWLSSGEYIQMSGRAGRRGKDDRGVVILMVDQAISSDIAKNLIKGAADPLNSQFRLTYNMILNLMRVEGVEPDFILKKSFYHFQNQMTLPDMYKQIRAKKEEIAAFVVPREAELFGVHELEKQLHKKEKAVRDVIMKPGNCIRFMSLGRVIRVKWNDLDFGWGVVVSVENKPNPDPTESDPLYFVNTILKLDVVSVREGPAVIERLRPAADGVAWCAEIVPVNLASIATIARAKLKLTDRLNSQEARKTVIHSVEEVQRRVGLERLDPIGSMKITDPHFAQDLKLLTDYQDRYAKLEIRNDPKFEEYYKEYEKKVDLYGELNALQQEFKRAQSESLLAELEGRKRVLRRLEYCTEGDIITRKGLVACEISAADELLLTEMIFSDVFRDLDAPTSAALLSCFICQEKGDTPKLAAALSTCLNTMQTFAKRIAQATKDARLEIDDQEYVDSFRPLMMDIVHNWVSGESFKTICESTEVFEGMF
uniref:Superkiller viralicidic activity 2-like 2 n=1 Tax=Panagrellus redivivus TaxID=6233 RepID=A0A7E4VDN8_PANRE